MENIKKLIQEGNEYLVRLSKALNSKNLEKDKNDDKALKAMLDRMKELINY